MPPASLRDRLGSLGSGGRRSWQPAPWRPAVERQVPRGFEPIETPYGPTWRLVDVLPVGRMVGPAPPTPHAYLDTETTGLAGGTGTQVFAASVCRPGPSGLELTQLFLADPAGEPAFLHLLQQELLAADAVATYNGSSFDLPLLRTRWIMARLPGELQHPAHLDLLTLTRSLYRQRLESCSLRVVEERVLGFDRQDDLPGSLVPQAYFSYIRRGRSPTLEAALRHNRDDVLSLYHLHSRIELRLRGQDPRMEAPDWLALGRHLLRGTRRADGWRALRRAAEEGSGQAAVLAGLLLARGLGRRRRYRTAERLLTALLERQPAEAHLTAALARLLEWRLGEPAAARELVAAALDGLAESSPDRSDLERRLRRLDARLARSRSAVSPAPPPRRAEGPSG